MDEFVTSICRAQVRDNFDIETALLENIKIQIESRKYKWIILFEIPHSIRNVTVSQGNKLNVLNQIMTMFERHAGLLALHRRMSHPGEYIYDIEVIQNIKDLELMDRTSLYGLKFFSSPNSINGKLNIPTVQELLKN